MHAILPKLTLTGRQPAVETSCPVLARLMHGAGGGWLKTGNWKQPRIPGHGHLIPLTIYLPADLVACPVPWIAL